MPWFAGLGRWGAAPLVLMAALGIAQAAETALEQELTGGSSRAWMEEGGPVPARAGAGCGMPDSFTFATTREVLVGRCIQGRPVSTRYTWRVEIRDGRTSLIVTGLGDYAVMDAEPDAQGARRLLLRPLVRDQEARVVELRFQSD